MSVWLDDLGRLAASGKDCALVTIVGTRGSTPREAGTRMVVTGDAVAGTVGGGQLEYRLVERAREMLGERPLGPPELHEFTLGPELRQCCGGVVNASIETVAGGQHDWLVALAEKREAGACAFASRIDGSGPAGGHGKMVIGEGGAWGSLGSEALDECAIHSARRLLLSDMRTPGGDFELIGGADEAGDVLIQVLRDPGFRLVLFGAGHVGRALVSVLRDVPCRISWVDSRASEFPDDILSNVTVTVSDAPEDEVARAPAGSFYLVMTHSHPTDFRICEAVLRRDFAFLGLIGSKSKRNRFRKNLMRTGIPGRAVGRLTCPIGIDTIHGKHPSIIGVAVAAQLIEIHESRARPVAERAPVESPAMADV